VERKKREITENRKKRNKASKSWKERGNSEIGTKDWIKREQRT
jgi:hypothetical protein